MNRKQVDGCAIIIGDIQKIDEAIAHMDRVAAMVATKDCELRIRVSVDAKEHKEDSDITVTIDENGDMIRSSGVPSIVPDFMASYRRAIIRDVYGITTPPAEHGTVSDSLSAELSVAELMSVLAILLERKKSARSCLIARLKRAGVDIS